MRSGATRRRRYAGSAAASAKSPGRSSTAASGSARSWWADCCVGWATAVRPTARPGRGRTIPTATPSSPTSTQWCRRRSRRASRPSRWTPRRRSWSATSSTPAANCAPRAGPEPVRVHDFELPGLGKVAPYGVYDLAANAGWVSVGVDADTAAFAVESIRRWWCKLGKARYPQAKRLVITADCGGSNGARVRLWKRELQRFADETGLAVTVAHLPPGTSKWNRIEHRLFAHISRNWRGKPLVSHQVIVQLIGATTTQTGLTVRCEIDASRYPKGIKVTDAEMAELAIERDPFHGEWNYTISPNQQPH